MAISTGSVTPARLVALDGGVPSITFQINPMSFKRNSQIQVLSTPGANNENTGTPKGSFGTKQPITIVIENAIWDFYDSGGEGLKEIKNALVASQDFVQNIPARRVPVYSFEWGERILRRCMVENLSYEEMMPTNDGKLSRLIANFRLKEVDEQNASNQAGVTPNPTSSNRGNPTQQVASLFSSLFLNFFT